MSEKKTTTSKTLTPQDYFDNFPFESMRDKQRQVLTDICEAFNSGYKVIILEAPTGFGKSPVAITVARTMGSSYICSATKELQAQYCRDFPFLYPATGMNNFPCLVKEDFIRNNTYRCKTCDNWKIDNIPKNCVHKNVDYGPCGTDNYFKHDKRSCNCSRRQVIEHNGCKYRTFPEEYVVLDDVGGTKDEQLVHLGDHVAKMREQSYNNWAFIIDNKFVKNPRAEGWTPCGYYDQLNKAVKASHSIFNYSNFLIFLRYQKILGQRDLLILDEGHTVEQEVVKHVEVSISRKRLSRYIPDLKLDSSCEYDVAKWLVFLKKLSLDLVGAAKKIPPKMRKNSEFMADYNRDLEKVNNAIANIESCSVDDWIVAEIKVEGSEIERVKFKPLTVASYCTGSLFDNCERTLTMSATILDHAAFCRSVGLDPEKTKFIQVGSDFPVENRPIYPLNVAYLNFNNLGLQETKNAIVSAVDRVMTKYGGQKGIIHTTSYAQLNFIRENVSRENRARLKVTDPGLKRTDVMEGHIASDDATVLISPSLFLGIDLKDDLSRFQVIVKVPYPSKGDRWTDAKRERDQSWYYWQTALRLIQAYGRSIRSKNDWAHTYILDSAFQYFIRKNKMPGWFMEAIHAFSNFSGERR